MPCLYRPSANESGYEEKTVEDHEVEAHLGDAWFKSPADFGVETCPGLKPDPAIAANKGKVPVKEAKRSKA